MASKLSLPPEIIKLFGDWSSDAYLRYLDSKLSVKSTVARALALAIKPAS
ncbi:MAG: hypothetical protein GY696_08280 [Gammaproteobacteria bacterium]|nr:hypothetical protein [Gammaproteobacteria bacterium]